MFAFLDSLLFCHFHILATSLMRNIYNVCRHLIYIYKYMGEGPITSKMHSKGINMLVKFQKNFWLKKGPAPCVCGKGSVGETHRNIPVRMLEHIIKIKWGET